MSEHHHQSTFQAPEVEEVSQLFPSYDIHCLIACGGMGAVYRATQRSLDRIVAIKILPREFSMDAAFRAGFESEAKAMAKLNHPNLIGVYDFGEADGMLYIVMEYVAGNSLFQSAHGFAVEQTEAIAIVTGICRGLSHAHDNGVLHRDIKPSNILIDANVNPKIGDFGLARALEREIEEGEQIFGTPGYTAPEVLQPPFTIDQRADIYSVGVMLHELLTGKLPEADPRPASQISGSAKWLDAIIFRALNPDPKARYSTAAELADALTKIPNVTSRVLLTANMLPPARPHAATSITPTPRALQAPQTQAPVQASSALPKRPALGVPGSRPIRTGTKVAVNESSPVPMILVFVAILGVIGVVIAVSGNSTPPPENAPPIPIAPQIPVAPAKPVDGVGSTGKPPSDPDAALRRARSSISHRVEPMIESRKRDMKANLLAFEASLRRLPALRQESGLAEIFQEWQSRGNRIPDSLPRTIADADGAEALFDEHLRKQNDMDASLERDLKSQSGVYVLNLQNQIEQLSNSGNREEINALEAEVRRVEADPDYFISIMKR